MSVRNSLSERFTVNRHGVEMAILFSIVLAITALASFPLTESAQSVAPPEQFGDGTTGETTAAATWAIAEVIFAGLLLAVIYAMGRAPDWVATTVKNVFAMGLLLWVGTTWGAQAGASQGFLFGIAFLGTPYVLYRVLDRYGLWWLMNNLLSVIAAIGAGIILGSIFGPVGLGVAALILTVYDHYFANEKEYMFEIGAAIVKYRLPVLFLRPAGWRFSWDDVVDQFDTAQSDEELDDADSLSWGLGTADMMLPAGILSAVITSGGRVITTFGLVAVIVLGLGIVGACFRLSKQMETHGSGAGLPALASGIVGPYVILLALATVAQAV